MGHVLMSAVLGAVFWSSLLLGSVQAQERQALAEGVAAYRAGDLASAEAFFGELLDGELSGEARAQVQYNLGNVAFREERFLDAVARYSAAVASAPRSGDAWHNLELARSRAGLDAADGGDLVATLRRLAALPTDGELVGSAWGLVALLALLLLLEVRRGGSGLKWLVGLGVLALVLDLAWLEWRVGQVHEHPAMVVRGAGAELHSEPREDLGLGLIVEAAEGVEILDRLGAPGAPGTWVKVDAEAGIGWIPEEQVLAW